jgi:hypothetical protein
MAHATGIEATYDLAATKNLSGYVAIVTSEFMRVTSTTTSERDARGAYAWNHASTVRGGAVRKGPKWKYRDLTGGLYHYGQAKLNLLSLAVIVGEPVILTSKMPFDEWFDVKDWAFNQERLDIAAGRDLETTIQEAVEMLLHVD